MTVSTPARHNAAEMRFVEAAELVFAYRSFGRPAGLPLALLQHFRGSLDNWDPAQTYPAEVAADVNAFLARDEGGAGS